MIQNDQQSAWTNYSLGFARTDTHPYYADKFSSYAFNSTPYVAPTKLNYETSQNSNVTSYLYSRDDFLLYVYSSGQVQNLSSAYHLSGNGLGIVQANPSRPYTFQPQDLASYHYDPPIVYPYYSEVGPDGYGEPIDLSISGQALHGNVQLTENIVTQGGYVGYNYEDTQTHTFNYVYTPDENYQGQDSFSLKVTDRQGNSKQLVYNIFDVDKNLGVNFSPGNQANQEGDSISLALPTVDQHQNDLSYTFQNLPTGLSFDPRTDVIRGIIQPGASFASPYQVNVTASNGYGAADSTQTFSWVVNASSPTIENADDTEWDNLNNAEGQPVSIPIVGSDPNNRPLTYSVTGLPPGLAIDATSGIISGTIAPGADNGTSYDVNVSVTNGQSTPATLEFPWTITRLTLATPSDQFNVTGDAVAFPVQVDNPRGGTLTYSADGLPDGLSIDPATGLISGVIAASAASGTPWQVAVDVSDGIETAEHTFSWKVWPGASVAAPQVADPGFESVPLTPGFYGFVGNPQGTPWTYTTSGAGVSTNGTGLTSGNPNAPQGVNVAFIQNQGAISQAINNPTAGTFALDFQAAQRANYGTSQSFQVLVDSAVVGTFSNLNTAYQPLTTASFLLSAGSHTIMFQGLNVSGDAEAFVDNISIITAAPPSTGDGLSATYFSNQDLTGSTVTRVDPTVNFDWGTGSPDPAIPVDHFSARWLGQVLAPTSGTYTFSTNSDDGSRLWVNGQLLVNQWTDHGPTESSGTITLVAGQRYSIKMEYYENTVGALAQLRWTIPSGTDEIIPQTDLYSTGGGSTPPGTYSLPAISLANPGNQVILPASES